MQAVVLADAVRRYRAAIAHEALPFWADVGVDGGRGFVEALDLAGNPRRGGFKRVRVHARQIYVFSHAATLGFAPGLEAAKNGLDFMLAHGRSPHGGFVVAMGEAGGIVDPERDLYDQAFVLLAFAWWLRASGDEAVVPAIEATLGAIDGAFARPDGEGYLSRLPDRGEALQNPHMHLFEALLALWEVRPDAALRARLEALLALFGRRLYDAAGGTLRENFALDWGPAAGLSGRLVEPGHHYEWTWLLHHAGRLLGHDLAAPAERLFAFAERHGVEPGTGLIHDALLDDGTVHAATHRSWPQTERIKAILARAEFAGVADGAALATALEALLARYLAPAPRPGTWIDHLDAAGRPMVDKIPASTLYHLFLSYAELERCKHLFLTSEGATDDR